MFLCLMGLCRCLRKGGFVGVHVCHLHITAGDALNKILHQLDLVKVLGEDPALRHCNGLKNLTKPELLQELVARKIPVKGLKTKEDLLKCLRDALQPGEQVK